jgi:uncharacterized membrane protein
MISARESKGAKEQRSKGAKEQRNKGTKEQRNKGTKEQRNKGTKIVPILALLFSCSLVLSVLLSFVPV